MEQIYQPQWLSLKRETREKLRAIFLIPKSAACETITNEFGVGQVISDGTTNADLQAITIEKLRDFIGSTLGTESIYDLFKMAVEKIEIPEVVISKEVPPTIVVPKEVLEKIAEKQTESILVKPEIIADSKVVGDTIKCEKCAFETKSKFAMRMHVGKRHPK